MPGSSSAARSAAALPVVLWLGAAVVSGFTMWRFLEPFDEGFLLQAASRMADGQWPYRDFGWAYGPGQPSVVAGAFELLGPSVVWWRVVRVAADATVAVLAWALVRRPAGDRWALVAWLAAAVTIAQPTSANPFTVALAFALGAVLAAARGRPLVAGALVALAVFWRVDIGLVAGVAASVAAGRLWADRRRRPPAGRPAMTPWAAISGTLLLYLPFAAVADSGRLFDSLVGTAAEGGGYWGLPFPLAYEGSIRGWPPRALAEDLKDVLGFHLPLIGTLAAAGVVAAVLVRRRRPGPELAGLLVLAAGAALYLASRPDDLHAQPLLVCLCALIPLAVAGAPAVLRLALAGGLTLIVLAGAANRLSALLLPPELEPVHLAGVPGIRVPPAEARALPALAARVQRLVPSGEAIYVAPRRSDLVTLSDPLIHFLVRRPNVLFRDVLVQARPDEQARIVAALRRTRPRVVVRWTDPASSRPERNRRGRPSGSRALDEHLATAYRLDSRFGAYDVLARR